MRRIRSILGRLSFQYGSYCRFVPAPRCAANWGQVRVGLPYSLEGVLVRLTYRTFVGCVLFGHKATHTANVLVHDFLLHEVVQCPLV